MATGLIAGRISRLARGAGRGALVLVVAGLLTGCVAPRTPTYPPAGSSPAPAGSTAAATVARVISAIAARGLQATETTRPFRPPEGARFAAAPRTVVQAVLATDPEHGFVVIYAFGSPTDAAAAAADEATYVSTGPGHLLFAPETRYTLRIDGSNVVFYTWSAANAADPRAADIETALATLGTGVTVPA